MTSRQFWKQIWSREFELAFLAFCAEGLLTAVMFWLGVPALSRYIVIAATSLWITCSRIWKINDRWYFFKRYLEDRPQHPDLIDR